MVADRALVERAAQRLMDSVEGSFVWEIGAHPRGHQAGSRRHRFHFLLGRRKPTRPAAVQQIVDESGYAIGR
jgi:hypothetical protein